jgi:hypothetical protein
MSPNDRLLEDKIARPATWLLSAFGDERAYAGNLGYKDDPTRIYRYDSKVRNSKRVKAGDVAILRSKRLMLGVARISEVRWHEGVKTIRKCPICKTGASSERPFACRKGHTFDEPIVEEIDCTLYEAQLAEFVESRNSISIPTLLRACPSRAAALSIQRLEPDGIRWSLAAIDPRAAELLPPAPSFDHDSTPPLDAAEDECADVSSADKNDVRHTDSSSHVRTSILARRGQSTFRKALMRRYRCACMVTGCTVPDIVEASHIAPYRTFADHSPTNGLLLRADIHTLFDLRLIAIEPATKRFASVRDCRLGLRDP